MIFYQLTEIFCFVQLDYWHCSSLQLIIFTTINRHLKKCFRSSSFERQIDYVPNIDSFIGNLFFLTVLGDQTGSIIFWTLWDFLVAVPKFVFKLYSKSKSIFSFRAAAWADVNESLSTTCCLNFCCSTTFESLRSAWNRCGVPAIRVYRGTRK